MLGQFDGYTGTEGIADDSTTDTYVAARLWIDTDRWRDVPFVLRTGKRLAAGAQQLSLLFRAPHGPLHSGGKIPEVLAFDLQGSGRIMMELTVKKPGPEFLPDDVEHVLRLDQVADGSMAPYTSLIYDVFRGDRALFTSSAGLADAFRPLRRCRDPIDPRWCRTPRRAGVRPRPIVSSVGSAGCSAGPDHSPSAANDRRATVSTGTGECLTIFAACEPSRKRLIADVFAPTASRSVGSQGTDAMASSQPVPAPNTISGQPGPLRPGTPRTRSRPAAGQPTRRRPGHRR